jgi:hypothetical protein
VICSGLLLTFTAAVQAQGNALQSTQTPPQQPSSLQQGSPQSGVVPKDSQVGYDPKIAAAQKAKASGNAGAADASSSGQGTTDEVLDALDGRNWQRNYDIRTGNVILLRRSTDTPAPAGTTVILRWRTPEEYGRGAFASSKEQRVRKPSGKFNL